MNCMRFLSLLSLCVVSAVRAADPQAYDVNFTPTGNGAMDGTLRASSELNSLQKSAPVSPFGLIARARGESDRLKTVLESYGYYQATVTVKIDGRGLNDPTLANALTALPAGQTAHAVLSFEPGPLYHLRGVTLDGTLPKVVEGVFTLQPGTPAVAADILDAGSRLLAALQEQGYAFARVDPPVAYEDARDPVLDVSFKVDAGARVRIGEIRLEGLKRLHERLVRRRLLLKSGEQYNPTAIERARRDLLGLAPIAAVTVKLGDKVDESGGVPVTFEFRERLRHAVSLNGAYSSDLGTSGGVTWTDRNVFGNAEQLALKASIINLGGGSATTGLGYDVGAVFTVPDVGHRDQSLQVSVEGIKQSLQAYDQRALNGGVTLTRKLSSVWTAGAGVTTSKEQIVQEHNSYNYTLLAVPLKLNYDSTHLSSPLDDPLHGMRDSLSVTPTLSLGTSNATFIILQAKVATYLDVGTWAGGKPGRTVLAARALAGIAEGAAEYSLPPDQRFYAGGSGTIRGYRYQAVGPEFKDGNPIGGTSITAVGVELRQRFGQSFGAAVFADGGRVRARITPGTLAAIQAAADPTGPAIRPENFDVGVGAGLRYYTPIGPVRLDIAVPTRKYSTDDDAFEVYIGLGQAF